MIRRDPNYYKMTPNQLLREILHLELVDQDVEKSLSLKMNKSLALNASSSEVVEVKTKTSKTKKEDTSDAGSTDEETAFAIWKYKKFLKFIKASKKDSDDRKKKPQRKCYECGEYRNFIAECPKNKNKNEEEKKYKEKSKEYKNKYQGRAHVGQQWDSSDEYEEPKKQGMTTSAMAQESSSARLFNSFSDDVDHSHFCLMARGSKVQETTTSSSLTSSSTPSDIDDLDDEKEIEANMIKQFSNKGYKEIKRLLEKLEKKKVSRHEQEDLIILEKERNLALERRLAEEAAKVKLTMDLSLANNSNKRMSKDYTLENESLASLNATHSDLESSFSCLTEKHKILKANYSTLWKSTKANPKTTLDSSASTSKGCSICSNIDINALKTNHALEETINSKDKEIDRLNMLVTQGKNGVKSIPKVVQARTWALQEQQGQW
jgi:hypothetical protein